MNTPKIVTCKDCFTVDEVTVTVDTAAGEWVYRCAGSAHGDTPFEWRVVPPTAPTVQQYREGYLAELDVYDTLLACILPSDPWLEYGVIEDRFRRRDPKAYKQLVDQFSHSRRNAKRGGPDQDPARTQTTSMRLAHALGSLASEGLCARGEGTATGYWGGYLSVVSYWAPVPAPDAELRLTWAEYAATVGADPNDWTLP